ncbi:MAG: DUF2807 domain-containing protein, partial [Bacteroidota bacterium]
IISLLCIALTFLISCEEEIIVGSGNIISESRELPGFDQLELSEDLRLNISQGSEQSITVVGDDNIVELISTEVVNGSLRIRFTNSDLMFEGENLAVINIVMPQLQALDLSSGGVFVENFQVNGSLNIEMKVDAGLDISGSASQLIVRMDDASTMTGFSLAVDECEVELNDRSIMEITVNENLRGRLNDQAFLRFKGETTVELDLNDSANLLDSN